MANKRDGAEEFNRVLFYRSLGGGGVRVRVHVYICVDLTLLKIVSSTLKH